MYNNSPTFSYKRCKANCAAKTIASEKLVLETSCSGCNQSQSIYYLWTVEPTDGSQAPKIWPDYAMTSQVFPSLVILPGALTGGKSYRFRVEAKKENGKRYRVDYGTAFHAVNNSRLVVIMKNVLT